MKTATGRAALRRLLLEPLPVGERVLPPLGLIAAATVGAVLLLIIATGYWAQPTDEAAYWRAAQRLAGGQPAYDPAALPGESDYPYFYPPPLAQLLAPLTALIDESAFSVGWTILLLACLWWLAGRQPLVALALIAFLPVAVELRYRNVHLLIAALVVLALRGRPWLFSVASAIKIAPGLGIVYLAARGRWRDAAIATGAGLAILAASVAASPDAWRGFIDGVAVRGPGIGASLIPVPFAVRAIVGLALAVVAGRLPPRAGEALLLVAVVAANPTLWTTVFSMLVALVPLLRTRARD